MRGSQSWRYRHHGVSRFATPQHPFHLAPELKKLDLQNREARVKYIIHGFAETRQFQAKRFPQPPPDPIADHGFANFPWNSKPHARTLREGRSTGSEEQGK